MGSVHLRKGVTGGLTPPQPQSIQCLDQEDYWNIHDRLKLEDQFNKTGYLPRSAIFQTLKLLDMNLVQVDNWGSGSNVPHDVDKGINVLEVKNEVVVHRVDRECQVESVEHPVQVIRFRVYCSSKKRQYGP